MTPDFRLGLWPSIGIGTHSAGRTKDPARNNHVAAVSAGVGANPCGEGTGKTLNAGRVRELVTSPWKLRQR